MAAHTSVPTVWAQRLGFGGLIPFVGLALALWVLAPAQRSFAGLALLGYGATIASFLGAIYWGLLMRDASTPSPRLLVWGVVPCLVAWLGLLVGPVPGLLLMAGLLWACFGVDRAIYPRFQMQGWLPMRLVLTVVASASCVAGAVALWR